MKRYIKKANVLIEALPYIQRFRNKIFVIKYGGSVIGKRDFSETVLQDIVFMECIGINPVLIHGGGHAINDSLRKHHIQPSFVNGLRVTDKKTLRIIVKVLEDTISGEIIDIINSTGGHAEAISGRDGVLMAERHKGGIGYVGEITGVGVKRIKDAVARETVPVVTPLACGADGAVYNVNADTAAGEIASALHAEKLIYLTDVEGIMRSTQDKMSLLSTLKSSNIQGLIEEKVIKGGMIPKVVSGLGALEHNVRKIHIIDGRVPHSMLLEIFTDKGIGTEIVR